MVAPVVITSSTNSTQAPDGTAPDRARRTGPR
jgi:hypothetical protein